MCEARLCAATGAGQDFLYGGVLIVYEKRGMCDTVTSSCTLADAEDSFCHCANKRRDGFGGLPATAGVFQSQVS